MAKKKRSGARRSVSPVRKYAKMAGTLVGDGLMVAPLIMPVASMSNQVFTQNKSVPASIEYVMADLYGISIRSGDVNWGKLTGAAIGSAATVGLGWAAKKYIVRRL